MCFQRKSFPRNKYVSTFNFPDTCDVSHAVRGRFLLHKNLLSNSSRDSLSSSTVHPIDRQYISWPPGSTCLLSSGSRSSSISLRTKMHRSATLPTLSSLLMFTSCSWFRRISSRMMRCCVWLRGWMRVELPGSEERYLLLRIG